jgi:hypothetical protein
MTLLYMNGFEALADGKSVGFVMGRNTGKSLNTTELLEGLVNDFDGDVVLNAAETVDIKSVEQPTFTWNERYYPMADPIRNYFTNFWQFMNGVMGEAKPPGFPKITRLEIGNGFGHQLRRRARILEPWNPVTMRPPRRFWVPAKRYAGINAYNLPELKYLNVPKCADWSRYAYNGHISNFRIRWKGGLVFELPADETGFYGTYTITYPIHSGWMTGGERTLRASERRARYSSTMDGNGKPRRKK